MSTFRLSGWPLVLDPRPAMDALAWKLTTPDGTVLGRLERTGHDMPWWLCRFTPTGAFAEVAALFDEELRLLDEDEMDAWDAAYARIEALGLELRPMGGGPAITEFLLHVRGDEAWFRA